MEKLEGVGVSHQEVLHMLKRANTKDQKVDLSKDSLPRFQSFDYDERIAIIHYLEYCAKDELEAFRINQALEGYWRPSVQSPS